jgi:polyferredoxin/Fe-S-cluster-containing hydrogenase component 2
MAAQPTTTQNTPETPYPASIQASRMFWWITALPIGVAAYVMGDFLLMLFPALTDASQNYLPFLPIQAWPILLGIGGVAFGLAGARKLVPLRITTVRIIVQTLVMGLFLLFVFATTFSHLTEMPQLQKWLSKFLEIDPLVAISTAITTGTVYKGLIWALILLIPTLLLGRIFCNWICPYGILHQFTGWAFGIRNEQKRIEANRYKWYYSIKYFILIGMITAAFFGNLTIGLLDPICLLHRSFTASVLPTLNMPFQNVFGDYKMHVGAWGIGFMLLFLVSMNLFIPRFFCRALCPLGATLGVLSRFALWRIERDPVKCTDCDLCLKSCEGASDPHTQLRMSECFVCFNCIEDCPHDALSFSLAPAKSHEIREPDIERRHAVFAGLTGALFFSFTQSSGKTTRDFAASVVRPPGTVEELEFLERCIKCDQCIRVCPTNVLQPALFESGLEGLWTPVMNFRMGFCQLNCTACGQVCPTGAIQRITVEEKLGIGDFEETGPVKLGTAHYDFGRCLPWSKNIPCVVCEEVCPTSPKAIHSERMKLMIREGKKQILSSTDSTITVGEYPRPGEKFGLPAEFTPNRFRGDQTTRYYVEIVHRDGTVEYHRISANSEDTLTIDGPFNQTPQHGDVAAIHLEFKVPKIDTEFCIGCGICEHECPIVGDRRAVYVTAEGETRSQEYLEPGRNRSIRLQKSASAVSPNDTSAIAGTGLSSLILGQNPQNGHKSSNCSSASTSSNCGGSCACSNKTASAPEQSPTFVLQNKKVDLWKLRG